MLQHHRRPTGTPVLDFLNVLRIKAPTSRRRRPDADAALISRLAKVIAAAAAAAAGRSPGDKVPRNVRGLPWTGSGLHDFVLSS